MYTSSQIDSMSNAEARHRIEGGEHGPAGQRDGQRLSLSPIGPMAYAEHYEQSGREMVASPSIDHARLEALGVDVPDWGLTEAEIREAGEVRLAEAKRERRRALAMVGLATYP